MWSCKQKYNYKPAGENKDLWQKDISMKLQGQMEGNKKESLK